MRQSQATNIFNKRFRSFSAVNMGSVDQRASKLLAFKFGGLKKKSATRPKPYSNQFAWVWLWLGLNHSQRLRNGNFAALWLQTTLKDIKLLKKYIKNQEAGCILNVCFALLKWPHFHSAYWVTESKHMFVVVLLRE